MRLVLLSGISICFQVLSQSLGQVTHVLLTRPPLTSEKQASHLFARLACIRHAASVRPEPGSNSHFPSWKWAFYRLALKLSLSYLKFIACELTSLLFGIFYIPHTFSETLFSFQGTTVAVWQLSYYIMSLELWQVIFLAPHLSQMTAL